jgi:hypothetical protein
MFMKQAIEGRAVAEHKADRLGQRIAWLGGSSGLTPVIEANLRRSPKLQGDEQ